MAGSSTEILIKLSKLAGQAPASFNCAEKYTTSYNGRICHLDQPYGVLKFSLHGKHCYAFFIFNNVFTAKNSPVPSNPGAILVGESFNFAIAPVVLPTVNNITTYHAGLVWKISKPKSITHISFDPDKAITFMQSYIAKAKIKPTTVAVGTQVQVSAITVPVVTAPIKAPKVKEYITGYTGRIWKVINNDEGLMFLRGSGDVGGKMIWFNRSNLEKVKINFNNLDDLLGVSFHFEAELLHASRDPTDYVWYQGVVFWEEGKLKPAISTLDGCVGTKIMNYKPTSDISSSLKQGVLLKSTNQFSANELDKFFKQILSNTKFFEEVSASANKVEKDKVAELWDNYKKLNEDLKNLKLATEKVERFEIVKVKQEEVKERRTSLPGAALMNEDFRSSTCSLPNRLKTENELLPYVNNPGPGTNVNLNYNWRGGNLFYQFPPDPKKITDYFEIPDGHFLNLQKTVIIPDHFYTALNFKTPYFCGQFEGNSKLLEVILPKETKEVELVDKDNAEDEKKNYLSSLGSEIFKNVFTDKVKLPARYLLKEPGLINHLSEDFKSGLIHCQFGCVYFKWDNFYDYDQDEQKWKIGKEIFLNKVLSPVFFDAYHDGVKSCPYVATCVWTEKRSDVQKLIETVADVPRKVLRGKFSGHVAKLDLPSNAIVKLNDENVGVVVTRGIFDPKKTTNIAEHVSLGENLEISIEDYDVSYYAKNAIRQIKIPEKPEKIEGCAVITNYSNRFGYFNYRVNNRLLTGVFSKDLARITEPEVTYLPVGSFIEISGTVVRTHEFVQIVATDVKNVKTLKKNLFMISQIYDLLENYDFMPRKIYTGVVKNLRKPYAFVLEAVNENGKKEEVFVSSKRFATEKGKENLNYADQIQFYVNVGDFVMFTAEVANKILDLRLCKYQAVKAWKIDSNDCPLDEAVIRDLNAAMSSGSKKNKVSNSTPKKGSPNSKPTTNGESLEEAILKTAVKNSLREETNLSEALINKIVDNFSDRLTNDVSIKSKLNKTAKVETKDKSTQTLSTGKVIYLKIFPS